MIFGPVPLDSALGAVLAHSARLPGGGIKKGTVLEETHIARLRAAGRADVVAARFDPNDMAEDAAAAAVAVALAPDAAALGLRVSAPFAGRVNLYALTDGLTRIDSAQVHAVNAVHESITLATLPDALRLAARRMVATVKIIPYAAPKQAVAAVREILAHGPAAAVESFARRSTTLILTRLPGQRDEVVNHGARAVLDRLAALGQDAPVPITVAHDVDALAEALAQSTADLTLILAASATSDRADVAPAATVQAGGVVERFGMPVDPGNLLMTGRIGSRTVICLPGCVRAPKLNGADWILERFYAGRPATPADIAAMGAGGLLKEIDARPQPRAEGGAALPFVSAVLLAAGGSSRMGDEHKLLKQIDGVPLIQRSAQRLLNSAADDVAVVIGARAEEMRAALTGLPVRIIEAPDWRGGLSASVRAGILALPPTSDAVLIALADMPDIGPDHINRLIAAFSPADGREIARLTASNGRPGNPALFGRRFFSDLAALTGDSGARALFDAHKDATALAPGPDDAALVDLDDPEAWSAWAAGRRESDARKFKIKHF